MMEGLMGDRNGTARRLWILPILSCALLTSVVAQGLDTTDYFPLKLGNRWYTIWFEVIPMFFAGTREITSTETINDTLYYLPGYYRKDSLGNVYQRIGNVDQLLYNLAANVGDTWTVRGTDTYLATLESHSENVVTFAGSFTRCKRFFFKDLDHLTDFDYVVWLAPGIGEVVWNAGMFLGYRGLKRAEIDSVVVSGPFHVVPLSPSQNQADVRVSSGISFYLDSVVDTNLVLNSVRVFSTKEGNIAGVVNNYGNNFQTYTFSPSKNFLPRDTITVSVAADFVDKFGEGLDGNGNGKYEGSPTDDYNWMFFTQTVTKVHDAKSTVPDDFVLHQNYPNPFNPSTTISFSLPKSSFVTLKVYNTLGQEVASLVNAEIAAGRHEVRWEAGNMPSGVYFYQLRAGGIQQTQKMILMK
jgi:hypothetical protein